MNDDTCLHCGRYVPEGSWVCPICVSESRNWNEVPVSAQRITAQTNQQNVEIIMTDNNEEACYRYLYELTVKKVKINLQNRSYHPDGNRNYDVWGTNGNAEVIEEPLRIWALSTHDKYDCDRIMVKFLKWNERTMRYDDIN